MPSWIKYLERLDYGQIVRSQGPKRHQAKAGTPTMGGVVIVAAAVIAMLLVAGLATDILLSSSLMLGYALIGLGDDWRKTAKKRSLGLKAREKLFFQIALAALLGAWLYGDGQLKTDVAFPFLGLRQLGLGYIALVALMVVSTANAVNLTDGLDGLAAGLVLVALLAFFVIAWEQRSKITIFIAATAGSCLGFLCFNKHPARVFMGDTGSLSLGAALASAAVFTKTEMLLIIIGGVFVLETLSTILQVLSFRLTGTRIFRMSPLHHHFELLGWSEPVVVRRFWCGGIVAAGLGLAIWYYLMA